MSALEIIAVILCILGALINFLLLLNHLCR